MTDIYGALGLFPTCPVVAPPSLLGIKLIATESLQDFSASVAILKTINVKPFPDRRTQRDLESTASILAELVDLFVAATFTSSRRQNYLVRPAPINRRRDSSPFRRICKPPLECPDIRYRAKAISDGVFREIDVHIPLEIAPFEPVQYVHGRRRRMTARPDREVAIDFKNDAHSLLRTNSERSQRGRGIVGIFDARAQHVWLTKNWGSESAVSRSR